MSIECPFKIGRIYEYVICIMVKCVFGLDSSKVLHLSTGFKGAAGDGATEKSSIDAASKAPSSVGDGKSAPCFLMCKVEQCGECDEPIVFEGDVYCRDIVICPDNTGPYDVIFSERAPSSYSRSAFVSAAGSAVAKSPGGVSVSSNAGFNINVASGHIIVSGVANPSTENIPGQVRVLSINEVGLPIDQIRTFSDNKPVQG